MKKTLTAEDIQNNPLLADCAEGDVLTVEHNEQSRGEQTPPPPDEEPGTGVVGGRPDDRHP